MSRLRYVVYAALLFSVTMAGSAKAAVEAVSFLNIEDFGLFVHTGGGMHAGDMISGGPGGEVALVGPPTFSSQTNADIASIPLTSNFSATGPTPASLDSMIAFQGVGAAPGDNSLFPTTNHGGAVPHALADTDGSGSIIADVGPPFGAAAFATSQVDLSTAPSATELGSSSTTSTSTASFTMTLAAPLDIIGVFDATRSLLADLTSAPPGLTAQASTSFSIAITGPGVSFLWIPGLLISGGTEWAAPFSLNGTVTTPPGSMDAFPTTTGEFRASVTLPPGTYSFSSSLSTTAAASSQGVPGVIPEPAAIAVWGLLALCAGGVAKYWLKK